MLLALQQCFSQQSPLTLFTNNHSAVIAIQQDTRYAECKLMEFAIITLHTIGSVNNSIYLTVKFPVVSTPEKYVFPGIVGENIEFAALNISTVAGFEKQMVRQIQLREFDLHDCVSLTYAYVSPYMQFLSFLLTIGNLSMCPEFVSFEKHPNGTYKYLEKLQYITSYDGQVEIESMLTGQNIKLVTFDEFNPCYNDDYLIPSYENKIQLVRCCGEYETSYSCSFRLKQILYQKTSFFYVQMAFQSRFGQRYVLYDIYCLHNSPEYSPHIKSVNVTLLENSLFFYYDATELNESYRAYLSKYKIYIGIAYSDQLFFYSKLTNASHMFDNWVLECGQDTYCTQNITYLHAVLEQNLDVRLRYMIYIYYQDELTIQQRIGVFITRSNIFIDAKQIQRIYVHDSQIIVHFTVAEAQYMQKVEEPVKLRIYDLRMCQLFAECATSMIFHSTNTWAINDQLIIDVVSQHTGNLMFVLQDSRGSSTSSNVIISYAHVQMKWFLITTAIGVFLVVLTFVSSKAQLRKRQSVLEHESLCKKEE